MTAATIRWEINCSVVKASVLFIVLLETVMFHSVFSLLMSFCREVTIICIPRAPEKPRISASNLRHRHNHISQIWYVTKATWAQHRLWEDLCWVQHIFGWGPSDLSIFLLGSEISVWLVLLWEAVSSRLAPVEHGSRVSVMEEASRKRS